MVRCPSKDFPQIAIINRAINDVLAKYPKIAPYIVLLKYGRDKAVNDILLSIADVRVIWGGDSTIYELRQSPMQPRAAEISFANRFSLVVIDADAYMLNDNKQKVALDFYNDTFMNDQNACTSPQFVIWYGKNTVKAKEIFWDNLHELVKTKYIISGVQAVNKLTNVYLLGAVQNDVKIDKHIDNLIIRIEVKCLAADLLDYKDNSGYFFEYDCKNILELRNLCNDTRCQTVSYIGDKEMIMPLFQTGIKGIDRIVPVGKTMDYDFIWDGYNLFERMTRSISQI